MKRNLFRLKFLNYAKLTLVKINKYFKGNECKKCPSGWSSHTIGTTEKCLFAKKTRIGLSQIDMFCQNLNATVPYPKTYQENRNYRDAFKSMNISTSTAIKSCHGVVELDRNGKWNPFPIKKLINVVCEKTLITNFTKFARSKRQASSGKCQNIYMR